MHGFINMDPSRPTGCDMYTKVFNTVCLVQLFIVDAYVQIAWPPTEMNDVDFAHVEDEIKVGTFRKHIM